MHASRRREMVLPRSPVALYVAACALRRNLRHGKPLYFLDHMTNYFVRDRPLVGWPPAKTHRSTRVSRVLR